MPTAAVLGAGGKTGQECVKQLANKGYQVKAVVRSTDKYKDTFPTDTQGKIELVPGDVTDRPSLDKALADCDGGVIFAASGSTYMSAKAVDCQGVVNICDAAKAVGMKAPIVLVSSCLVSPHNRWHPIRIMLNNIRYGLMDQKYEGEEKLRASGLPYTVIRPGGLKDAPAGQKKLVAGQGDKSSGSVSRADVAAVCVAALSDPAARNVTMELTSKDMVEGTAVVPLTEQLKNIFKGLKPGEK